MPEESQSQPAPVSPYPLAMVICDAIHRDPGSGKSTILGCFSSILAPQFPAVHPLMCVYVSLTDGRGKTPLRLQVVDAAEAQEPIAKVELEADFKDPRMIFEVNFALQNLVFPSQGEYRIQLFAGNEHVIERRLVLLQTQGEKP